MATLNFRETAGFVTDPVGQVYVIEDNYPTTRGGLTFGAVSGSLTGRDKDAGNPAQLAGIGFNSGGAELVFRLDLPAAGNYRIRLATGDPQFAQTETYIQIRDDATPVLTLDLTGAPLSGENEFVDAAGTLRVTPAVWVSDNQYVDVAFSSTICNLVIGNGVKNGRISTLEVTPITVLPVVSAPTPSGTLGTATTASIGGATTQTSGTARAVLSTSSGLIAGITAAQVLASQLNNGSAAPFTNQTSVSASPFSIGITGLTPNTTYYYAVAQTNSNGNSNVITGSFTTAVSTTSCTVTLRDASGNLLNSVSRRFWTKNTIDGAAVDGGSAGLSVTCNASGVFNLTGLTIPAGGGKFLQYGDASTLNKYHVIPMTYS